MDIYLLIVLALVGLVSVVNLVVSILKKCPDVSADIEKLQQQTQYQMDQSESVIRDEFRINRTEAAMNTRDSQIVLTEHLSTFSRSQHEHLTFFQNQLSDLIKSNQGSFHHLQDALTQAMALIRQDVNERLKSLQSDNSQQLEKIRNTVDEKLHKTLEERLGRSFQQVSQHLEAVQKGLGEMQNLAAGVGDLKKVLSNVKTRGVLGEIQLSNILEQIMTPDQYGLNIATIPGSGCHVEFAIKLPGRDDDDSCIWLPIDSKFPMDRYQQVVDAYDSGIKDNLDQAQRALRMTVKSMAKDIKEKYIAPPHTTDFGILFLPVEGLYAEVVRSAGLMEELQRDYKIILAGPSNLAAFLNSIQMGFRSLAIQKRSSEVWKVLGAVKTEFGKFGDVLTKVQNNLNQASKSIDRVSQRSRAIERNLRKVEVLPDSAETMFIEDGIEINDLQIIPDL